jgi:hypothetical protein
MSFLVEGPRQISFERWNDDTCPEYSIILSECRCFDYHTRLGELEYDIYNSPPSSF